MVNYAYLHSQKTTCIFALYQVGLMLKHTDYHCLI
nr:MAG TPA: hypothetical protein [Caudoviricetes sp.]